MANNKVLIDAAHPEEVRVVVVRDNKIDEFDYESTLKRQLRGNIYLAKITRVEPSLQAAFVDYGGNRHGFLAFGEIHPDYYQIPVADRQELLAQEAEAAKLEAEAEEAAEEDAGDAGSISGAKINELVDIVSAAGEIRPDVLDTDDDDDDVELVGAEDEMEEILDRRQKKQKRYKIQEVIRRNQIILVQVVKEERGNKGAALTTYLSLAGRHTVLMPNATRGGGISRKITNLSDRKKLRKMVNSLGIPDGMGLIIRTAGAACSEDEIKRDYDYLLRLWKEIRDLTMKSSAPAIVYEEGNLLKRSIRDLYGKNVDKITVAGEHAYNEARNFMAMLLPDHVKNVQLYKGREPLFSKNKVENQLNAMFSPYAVLPSGGYLVINQTEALVAVDVNSGKATKEHSIEETAVATNLEAAEEISRQLRLRDLAGLIVIDFIDMDDRRNNRAVERKLKECLKNDRARIQVGRISPFGLLEMSRQRLRMGVLEGSSSQCKHCSGSGVVRSTSSVSLYILRSIEDRLIRKGNKDLTVNVSGDVAFYILNEKRDYLRDMERRFDCRLIILVNDSLSRVDFSIIETSKIRNPKDARSSGEVVHIDSYIEPEKENDGNGDDADNSTREKKKPSRRRSRRGSKRSHAAEKNSDIADADKPEGEGEPPANTADDSTSAGTGMDEPTKSATEKNANRTTGAEKPKPRARRRRPRKAETGEGPSHPDSAEQNNSPDIKPEPDKAADIVPEKVAVAGQATTPEQNTAPAAEKGTAPEKPAEKRTTRRRGWWQRGKVSASE
jgi:ribonuclease E